MYKNNLDVVDTSLGIPLKKESREEYSIDLTNLRIFWGLSILSRTLGDEIVERVISSPGDVAILHKLNPNINNELCEMHIGYIQIHARAGVLKDILLFREEFQDHIRTVFGTFQRQVWAKIIHPEFYAENPKISPSKALVFPFHHNSTNENVDYQFILERVVNQVEPGEFIFRLTIENFDRANIDLKSIPYTIVEDLQSRIYIGGSTKISESIHSSLIGASQKGEREYIEENRRFNRVFEQIEKTSLGKLSQLNFYWEKTFASFLMDSEPKQSLPIFKKIFLILEDQEIAKLIKEGYRIRIISGKIEVNIDLSRLDRVLNYSFNQRRVSLNMAHYLSRMPELESIAQRNSHKLNLRNTKIFLIHHITSEILALLEAYRLLDAEFVNVCFVKYGGKIPPVYLDILLDLPTDSFYMSGLELKVSAERKTFYSVSQLFSDNSDLKELKDYLDKEELGFFPAMKLLSTHLFLKLCLDCYRNDDRLLLVEDGGYIAPFINSFCMDQKTLKEVAKEYQWNVDSQEGDIQLSEILGKVLYGSVEHTRNGYDRLLSVAEEKGKLFFPAYSIAISNQKVKEESKEVAQSILKAIEDVLHGQGKILSRRKFLVLGSAGNIGTFLCKYLHGSRLHDTNDHLLELDIKNEGSTTEWKYSNIDQIPKDILYKTDLFLGVIGDSILKENFWDDFLMNSISKNIFIASGSTKTAEFTHLIEWSNQYLLGKKDSILGTKVEVELKRIIDPQSQMDQGGWLIFKFEKNGNQIERNLFLLSDLSPINFLYYGAPTEIMDSIISDLLTVSLGMVEQAKTNSLPLPALYAVDHEIDRWGKKIE
jgi:hypothetical protein